MTRFTHLEKLIASSGLVLPSAAMEAIKADCAVAMRNVNFPGGGWISVDSNGSIYFFSARPDIDEDCETWQCKADWSASLYAGHIDVPFRVALRLPVYWRDYLAEI